MIDFLQQVFSSYYFNKNFNQIFYLVFFAFLIILFFLVRYFFIIIWKIFIVFFSKNLKIFHKFLNSIKIYKNFKKNHYLLIKFIKNRFDKNNFFWLSFSILFLLILFSLFGIFWITHSILSWELITQIDIRLSDFFYFFRDDRLIKLFLFISYFWNKIVIFILMILFSYYLFLKKQNKYILWLFSSVFSSVFIALISKKLIQRPRPDLAIYFENSYSFPSLHSVISISFYSFIIWYFLVKIKNIKKRLNLIFIWVFIAFLIWLSRLYLNVHYLSDVISWWFLWFLWLLFWISITWLLKHYFKKDKKIFKKINLKNFYIIAIFSLLFLFFNYNFYYNSLQFKNFENKSYIKINNIWDFLKNKNLNYSETITWRKTENINFIFLSKNDYDLITLFKNSWWEKADKIWRYALRKMWKDLLKIENYKKAPFTPLYWNKKIQDFSFQKWTSKKSIKYRHHIRIWKTNYKIWDYFIYVWVWVYDDWIKWGITHKIDPNIDKEREFIFWNLENNNLIKSYEKIQLVKPFKWKNFSWDEFFTDWKAYLIKLK